MSEKPIPDVLSHEKLPSYDRHSEYFNLHTAAERQSLYSGCRIGTAEPTDRINIDVTLDNQPCPSVCQYFDRDSFVAFADSIAVAAIGLYVYTQQALASNFTTSLHLPPHSIPRHNGDDAAGERVGTSRSRSRKVHAGLATIPKVSILYRHTSE